MKKMNVISLFLSLFLLASCSHQEQLIEDQTELETAEKESKNREQESEYFFGPQIYHLIAETEIAKLEIRKIELIEEKENGNEEATGKLETIQQSLNKFMSLSESMALLGKMPRPPRGCTNPEINCVFDISSILGITFVDIVEPSRVEPPRIEFTDSENNIVEGNIEIGETPLGEPALLFDPEVTGNGKMIFTINTETLGEMTLEVGIFKG